MRIDHFFLLKVWILSLLFITMGCVCMLFFYAPFEHEYFVYASYLFFDALKIGVKYTAPIFICLYLLFYLLLRRFDLSAFLLKSMFFILILIGVFIANYIKYPWTWLNPFFGLYITGVVSGFWAFKVYRYDLYYAD